MVKKWLFSLLLVIKIFYCSAQPAEKIKMVDHYFSIQANELLRQLINLNTNNETIQNPYLFTYSVFSTKYNWGIQAGFGLDYHSIQDKLSPTNQESKIRDVFFRIGIARNFMLGKKWEASAGIDYVNSNQMNKTFAFEVVSNFQNTTKDSTSTVSTSLIKAKGAGLQLRLGFHLSEHIMLSTEGTFYYQTSTNANNVMIAQTFTDTINPENDTYTLSSTNSETENSDFEITVPVAIFLTIKF